MVFVERRWLRTRLASKPTAATVAAAGKKAADGLLAYHEAMLGLEAEVRERRAVLCLLEGEVDENGGSEDGSPEAAREAEAEAE